MRDPDVGYVQGINCICAVLLLHMKDEQVITCGRMGCASLCPICRLSNPTQAFWVLCTIMGKYRHRELFLNDQPGLPVLLARFEALLRFLDDALSSHIASLGIEIGVHVSQWFLTIFSYCFTQSATCRVWDAFFVDGRDFLIRFGLVLLLRHRAELLARDFEGVILFIKGIPESLGENNIGEFISAAYELS